MVAAAGAPLRHSFLAGSTALAGFVLRRFRSRVVKQTGVTGCRGWCVVGAGMVLYLLGTVVIAAS